MRVKLNYRGFVALRNAPGVVADLSARADRIASAAGEGVETRPPETNTASLTGRARVAVVTASIEAMIRQARDSSLSRAIDAGR